MSRLVSSATSTASAKPLGCAAAGAARAAQQPTESAAEDALAELEDAHERRDQALAERDTAVAEAARPQDELAAAVNERDDLASRRRLRHVRPAP
jgi:hypothetical protein